MRIYYLDHLRTALIFLVVVLHASIAYDVILQNAFPWPVRAQGLPFFDYVTVILDIFLMPTMFYIAGYFTLPSLEKRGAWNFLKEKCVHILCPFILGVLILNPYPNYLMANAPDGYLHYWWNNFLKNLLPIDTHAKASLHLWFLAILFGFYLITVLIRPLFKLSKKITYSTFLTIAVLSFVGFLAVNAFVPDYQPWRNYMYLFTIQRTRLPLYLLYFILGILVRKHGWNFGKLKLFVPLSILFAALNAEFVIHYNADLSANFFWKVAHALLHNASLFCIFMALMGIFQKLNTPSVFLEKLSTNSYAVYIIHLNIVLYMQHHLLKSQMPIFTKWAVIIGTTYLLSNFISGYILKRTPYVRRMLY